MTSAPADFRCSAASTADGEVLAGSAPTEATWLFVEYAGSWGHRALAESRLDQDVRTFLGDIEGARVQLIRRHGGVTGPGVRVFVAALGAVPRVWTTALDDVRDVLDLDVASLADGAGLTPYDEPLWLVCTNGRRDLCCAEIGRPVAAALAARWPEGTWETTHLGGHRFAGTLLALPSGVTLGRVDPSSARAACAELLAGRVPVELSRGRAGLSGAAQVADLHVRTERGLVGLDEVAVTGVDGETVTLRTPGGVVVVRVETTRGEPRRQSCGDLMTKAVPVHRVVSWADLTAQ